MAKKASKRLATAPRQDDQPKEARFEFDVFLSHNQADKPKVRKLAERLKAAGVRVWLDEWVIQAGDIIALKVDEGLEQSRVLLLCISPEALASGWVALERSTAIHRDPANAGRRFIPLLLADCELPDTLRRYKYVDFREEAEGAFAELLTACCSPATAPVHITVREIREQPTQERPKASEAAESDVASIFVPVGYNDKLYIYSAYYLPLLFDKQFVYGPTKFGAQAVDVPAGDILTLALADDPAIVPVGFERWINGEEYRNTVLSPQIRETQGADEARKVLYVPEFDGKLEAVYKDASFEWFSKADQRLSHRLYIDKTALPMLLINRQNAVMSMRDATDIRLLRFRELAQRLDKMLPAERFGESDVRTAVTLLANHGLARLLKFGDLVLLRPDLLNGYAGAIIRAARAHTDEIGCVLEGDIYQPEFDFTGVERLTHRPDEELVLRALVQTFLDHSLCIAEETPQGRHLVFPSQYRRQKDIPPGRKRERVTVPWMPFRVSYTCTASVGVIRDLCGSLFEKIGFTHDR